MENVLFKGKLIDSTLKIIDFGKSRILKSNQKTTELAGTLYYVAPEILMGKEHNQTCDIWSCGIVMYMMLSGYPPFNGANKVEIINKIKEGKIDFSRIFA